MSTEKAKVWVGDQLITAAVCLDKEHRERQKWTHEQIGCPVYQKDTQDLYMVTGENTTAKLGKTHKPGAICDQCQEVHCRCDVPRVRIKSMDELLPPEFFGPPPRAMDGLHDMVWREIPHGDPDAPASYYNVNLPCPPGTKHDQDKPRWSLVPPKTMEQIVAVLEFGARKYQKENWKQVPDAQTRYYDALQRHINAWWCGEKNDPETGYNHLAHVGACVLFLLWFETEKEI